MSDGRIIEISTTIGCRVNCTYCPQFVINNLYVGPKILTFDNFKLYIKTIPTEVVVVFCGMSEPFQNNQCIEMICYAHNKGHDISIFTTTSGLSKDHVEILSNIPIKHFIIHLIDDKPLMNLNITDEYLEILKLCESKIKNCSFMIAGNLPTKIRDSGISATNSFSSLTTRAGNLKPRSKRMGHIECSGHKPMQHGVLLPNGKVILCCMDWAMTHTLGDLNYQTYDDLYNSAEYKKVVGAMNDDSVDVLCRYCEHAQAYKL